MVLQVHLGVIRKWLNSMNKWHSTLLNPRPDFWNPLFKTCRFLQFQSISDRLSLIYNTLHTSIPSGVYGWTVITSNNIIPIPPCLNYKINNRQISTARDNVQGKNKRLQETHAEKKIHNTVPIFESVQFNINVISSHFNPTYDNHPYGKESVMFCHLI